MAISMICLMMTTQEVYVKHRLDLLHIAGDVKRVKSTRCVWNLIHQTSEVVCCSDRRPEVRLGLKGSEWRFLQASVLFEGAHASLSLRMERT